MPDTAFDAGPASAESLGKGGTINSTRGYPAAGVENPAALIDREPGSFYATGLVGESSDLPNSTVRATNPLGGKVLQFLGIGADRGVLYFQPLARLEQRQVLDPANPATSFRDVELSANAIGFAGAAPWRKASIGISLAYLWSAMSVTENRPGTAPETRFTTGNGVRLNVGVRVPTGPVLWGLLVQNAPAFIWGDHYRREMLPLGIRAGTTWKAASNLNVSLESETRFYNEGGNREEYLYLGAESKLSDQLVLRAGTFGTDIGSPEERRVTGGLSYRTANGATLSYALESYEEGGQRIRRSFVSLQSPFVFNEGK